MKSAAAKTGPANGRTDSGQTIAGVVSRLIAVKPSLGRTAQRIASYIIESPSEIVHMSVTELADACDASEASVVALCQQIGASGFQNLKISLAQELVRPEQFIHESLNDEDSAQVAIKKVFHTSIEALNETLTVIDVHAMNSAVDLLVKAERIEIYGIGVSAPIAEILYNRMVRIGLNCRLVLDSHLQAISASLTGPNVTTVSISHSGSSRETLTATKIAREAGARTIGITNFGKSPLQSHSDVVLQTLARETRYRTEATTSRVAQLVLIDSLIALLALRLGSDAVEAIQKTLTAQSAKHF